MQEINDYYNALKVVRKSIHPTIPLAPSPKEYYINGSDGIPIFVQSFIPNQLNAVLLCQHGNTIQGDIFYPLADILYQNKIGLIAVDNSGHGRSGKQRGDFNHPERLFPIYSLILDEYYKKKIPCHILGESLGCTVISKYLIENPLQQQKIHSIILQVPPFNVRYLNYLSVFIPLLRFVLTTLHIIFGQQPVIPSIPGKTPSYFTEFLAMDKMDRIHQPKTSFGHFANALYMLDLFHKIGHKINKPVLILEGSGDTILNPEGSIQLFHKLTHVKRRIHLFKNAEHSLYYDVNSQGVYDEIFRWIQKN